MSEIQFPKNVQICSGISLLFLHRTAAVSPEVGKKCPEFDCRDQTTNYATGAEKGGAFLVGKRKRDNFKILTFLFLTNRQKVRTANLQMFCWRKSFGEKKWQEKWFLLAGEIKNGTFCLNGY